MFSRNCTALSKHSAKTSTLSTSPTASADNATTRSRPTTYTASCGSGMTAATTALLPANVSEASLPHATTSYIRNSSPHVNATHPYTTPYNRAPSKKKSRNSCTAMRSTATAHRRPACKACSTHTFAPPTLFPPTRSTHTRMCRHSPNMHATHCSAPTSNHSLGNGLDVWPSSHNPHPYTSTALSTTRSRPPPANAPRL